MFGEKLLQDIRLGARTLRKNRMFTLSAAMTLALGIGGTTAAFSVIDALLLRPFPYRDPKRLVRIDLQRRDGSADLDHGWSLLRFDFVRQHSRSFVSVAAFTNDSANLTGGGEPQQVPVARVSPGFLGVLGVRPQLGRAFTEEEGQPAGSPVILISDSLWHTRFGGDPRIVGKIVDVDSAPQTIVGVLPAGIRFPFMAPAEVWSPRYFELSMLTPQHIRSGVGYLSIIARLSEGAPISAAAAEMNVANAQYARANPKTPDGGPNASMAVRNLQEATVAGFLTRVFVLSACVGLVLIMACANVGCLLLSRALTRREEMAIRVALGAGRVEIVRQLLVESVLLTSIGGVLGFALGWSVIEALQRFGARDLLPAIPIGMDWRAALFAAGASILSGIGCGIVPAFEVSRAEVGGGLVHGRGGSERRGRTRIKDLLVVAQVSISVLLLAATGLLIRSFERLSDIAPGFDAANVLTMNVSLPTVKYSSGRAQIGFFRDLLQRVSAVPGVRGAAVSAALPLSRIRMTPILAEGQPEVPLAERPLITIEAISPGFFQTMRIPLRKGRAFTDADDADAPLVVVVNQALAGRYWPDLNSLGRHIFIGRRRAAEIVGVSGDVKNNGLAAAPEPQIYLPFAQLPWGNMNLLVRTAVPPRSLAPLIRKQVLAIDPDQPVTGVQTVEDILDDSRARPRLTTITLGTFAAVALVLASLALYGALAYSVAERRREIGIRLALGASESQILHGVIGRGLTLTAVGAGIGMAAAIKLTPLMAGLLYGVGARDFATFAITPTVLVGICLLASYLPARRATLVDPAEVLRLE